MINSEILIRANEFLSNSKLANCINLLEANIDDENKARILILKNQFLDNKQAKILGTISNEDFEVKNNNIIFKLTQLINDLKSVTKVKIYFIGHSCKGMNPISFEKEYDEILTAVNNSTILILHDKIISSLDELILLLAEQEEIILHFACHGNVSGLFLSDDKGEDKYETNSRIFELLKPFDSRIKCVILNACLSESLGERLASNICNVICMNKEVIDESSVKYSIFFYRYLLNTPDINFEKSHQYAKEALSLRADQTNYTVEFIKKINI